MNQQLDFINPFDTPNGNKKLVSYGIQNEGSDFRCHVGYQVQRVYVFPTQSGRSALNTGLYSKIPVVTNGIVTAEGYRVPISHIDGMKEVIIPIGIYNKYRISRDQKKGVMGTLATAIVVDMLMGNLIPLPVALGPEPDKALQIDGCDILINASLKIQVKCDYGAGSKALGGTGNVFLQVSECNPWRQH